MRGMQGKLITVWSPGLHGMGTSTVTDAVGFAMQYLTDKKVLILNQCGRLSFMERFVEKDIKIKYTMDNLKIFDTSISAEHIYTYATSINENLYMVAGSRFERDITKEDKHFAEILLSRCLEAFDIVVVDTNTGIREDNLPFLDKADSIIAVVTANEIMLDDLLEASKSSHIKEYLYGGKALVVVNKLYDGRSMDRELRSINKKYDFEASFGLNYNGDVFDACCRRRQFYSFMMDELAREKAVFGSQVTDICDYLIERLYLSREVEKPHKRSAFMNLFTI